MSDTTNKDTVTGDGYAIPQEWTFKRDDIAKAFDRHVREQLPWYDLATGVVAHFARHYLIEGGVMYDIGASTGNITKALKDVIESRHVAAHSIEVSKEMCDIWNGTGMLHNADCRTFEYKPFDFAVVFLVLMFLPPKDRDDFMNNLMDKMEPGGAILVFEKVAHQGGYIGNALARLTLSGKVATKVPAEEIVAKEISLGGIQRPITPTNIKAIRSWGTPVFQFGEFVGWIVTKD